MESPKEIKQVKQVNQPKKKEMNDINLKELLKKDEKMSEQVAVKLSNSQMQKVKQMEAYYNVNTSKIMRAAVEALHNFMIQESKKANK